MTTCPFCHFANEPGALFCDHCADLPVVAPPPAAPPQAAWSVLIHCPFCAFDNEGGALFCERCTSDLSGAVSVIVNEQGWLDCTNPTALLDHIADQASSHKLRLVACACLRQAAAWTGHTGLHRALLGAERFADGALDARQLRGAFRPTWPGPWEELRDRALHILTAQGKTPPGEAIALVNAVGWLAEHVRRDKTQTREPPDLATLLRAQADFLREILGNPFRRVSLQPAWLSPQVQGLAAALSADHDFAALPVLADALEEAGCTHAALLEHLRGPNVHLPGCWALDAILGRE